jgi:hypothetical protein
MKISKADLISLITEVLEEDTDKFQKALETLRKKQQGFKVQSAKVGVDIAKVTLAQAQERESVASDALDAAENRGEDVSKETESLNNAKESTQKARDGVNAANNALKVAQKGGVTT